MFNSEEFKMVIGHFATGITVVLLKDCNQKLHGITVNSFNSVSLTPPLVLYSINKNNKNLSSFVNAEKFTVNILTSSQIALSQYFADKNKNLSLFKDYYIKNDSIIINNSLAYLTCKPWKTIEAGDHVIIISNVIHLSMNDNFESNSLAQPMVYFNKSYHHLGNKIND